MNRSTLLFLLCCSVLFNVFFILGALQWSPQERQRTSPMAKINEVVSEMELDAEQRTAFEQLRAEFEAESELLGGRIKAMQRSIGEALNTDQPDLEEVDALVRQQSALRHERRRAGSERFEAFLAILTPKQRHALGRRMQSRPPDSASRHDQRRALKKFDLNQNGELEPEEQQAADEFMEERRRKREQDRDALHERYDQDGDGFLSPEEERALHEHLRSRSRQRPDRP
jgi:Spy/CpxP family protein refolding chaperone